MLSSSLKLISIVTSRSIVLNISFKNFLILSSTAPLSTTFSGLTSSVSSTVISSMISAFSSCFFDTRIFAGLLFIKPNKPFEPFSITSYSRLSLDVSNCNAAFINASSTVFPVTSIFSIIIPLFKNYLLLLFFSLNIFTILALAARLPGFAEVL